MGPAEITVAPAAVRRWRPKLPLKRIPYWLVASVLLFYWAPLFFSNASIQGETADVTYPLQKYFADRIFSGTIPLWTPYIYSGYPIMANPLMAAWYPLNYPFYYLGITPGMIEWELAFHAFLACLGTYLLLRQFGQHRSSAAAGGFAYGLSGYFAAHSSYAGAFVTAAWLPWVVMAYRRGTEAQKLRFAALGAVAGGLMILSGHLQTAGLALLGIAVMGLADAASRQVRASRAAWIVTILAGGALLISAVQLFPAMELWRYGAQQHPDAAGTLRLDSLLTLVMPWRNRGPGSILYFYGGFLLLPMAALGLMRSRFRGQAIALIVFATWYGLGPAAGLYNAVSLLPCMRGGAPANSWFLAAFGLAMLAGAGFEWTLQQGRTARIAGMVLAAVLFGDLMYWNSAANPLAYARKSFDVLYGVPEQLGKRFVALPQLALNRFNAPSALSGVGPLLSPLDIQFETTYGDPLTPELELYRQYRDAEKRNIKLWDGLNVSRFLDMKAGDIDVNTSGLPRAYFPHAVQEVLSEKQSRDALERLDPTEASTVLPPHGTIDQDFLAGGLVVGFDEGSYRVHYVAKTPSLLKLSVPWYPGWTADISRREIPLVRVDHALMGVVLPAGEFDVQFSFHSRFFYLGCAVSIVMLALAIVIGSGGKAYRKIDRFLFPDGERYLRRKRVVRRRSSI